VKGSIKKVTIYDLFQTDDRALYLYKEETKEAFQRAADGILEGKIRLPPRGRNSLVDTPLTGAANSFNCADANAPLEKLVDFVASESHCSLPGTVGCDGAADAMNESGSRKTAAARVKQLREAISNPSPRVSPSERKIASPLMKALATRVHPDLVILNTAMEKYGVHDHAVDALFQYTDEEGCMLLDSK
jgi:hypothetical protein